MEAKTIDIPFDYQEYVDNQKIVWEFSNKKFVKSQSIFTIFSTVLLIFALTNIPNHFLIAFLVGYFFYILMGWSGFYERRVKFYKAVKKQANNPLIQAGCRFIFSDFGIEYEDKEKSYKLSWPLFRSCVMFKEHLLLIQKSTISVTFIFSKKELEENYREISDLLKAKLDQDTNQY